MPCWGPPPAGCDTKQPRFAPPDEQDVCYSWWCGLNVKKKINHPGLPQLPPKPVPAPAIFAHPQDVCYSWWCLSALSILDRLHWIDQAALTDFILDCQVGWSVGID